MMKLLVTKIIVLSICIFILSEFCRAALVPGGQNNKVAVEKKQKYNCVRNVNFIINTKKSCGQNAIAVMDELSMEFGVQDSQSEFKIKRIEKDNIGYKHVRLEQVYKRLPVVGGDIVVHFNSENKVYEVSGSYVSVIGISTNPLIKISKAVSLAKENLYLLEKKHGNLTEDPQLMIFAYNTSPHLAYEVILYQKNKNKAPCRWHYFVSTKTGKIIFRYNSIKTAPILTNGIHTIITGNILEGEGGALTNVLGWYNFDDNNNYLCNTNLEWYVCNSSPNNPARQTTNNWGTSNREAMSAALNFNIVVKYFQEVHYRNNFHNGNYGSFDEHYACAIVHVGNNFVNAYWDGVDFHFGDGDGVVANSFATLDICGHEFTHAVTDYSSDLFYSDESGALNESFSDIFGTAIEFYGQLDRSLLYPDYIPGYADWLDAEDCWLAAPAMRDIRNPANTDTVGIDDEQPTRYLGDFWYLGSDDNGGVHQNSGVQNFFFYLLCEGGSGTNNGIIYNVTGINITNVEQIAYRALTVYCSRYTDYSAARQAWISAAEDLNPAWIANVEAAWDAVGVSKFQVFQTANTTFSGTIGGPFLSSTSQYELKNKSSLSLEWAATNNQTWLNIFPSKGFLEPGGITNIFLSNDASANALPTGNYIDTLTITDISNEITEVRNITLRVLPPIISDVLIDDFFPGWPIDGCWAYGSPDGVEGDPSSAYSGTNIYGYNLAGAYRNNIPEYFLTTRALDFSNFENISFSFWRWLGVEGAEFDHAKIQISSNKKAWVTIWENGKNTIEDTNWQRIIYNVSEIADRQKTVYIRWGMGSTDVGLTFCGWNIDDIVFYGTEIDKLQILPDNGLDSYGFYGGPFYPSNIVFDLENTGSNILNWSANSTSSWVDISLLLGSLTIGETDSVTLSLNSEAETFGLGNYFSEIVFSNISSGAILSRPIKLVVLETLVANFTALPQTGAAPLTVDFQDNSSGDIKSWNWDFDNNGTIDSTNQNTEFTFFDVGNYNVNLKIYNNYLTNSVNNLIVVTGNSYSVRYVSKTGAHIFPFVSWENAATNIQAAVDAALPGNTVLVTNGIYDVGTVLTPDHLLSNRVVINKAITIQSVNGPDFTIIAGDGQNGTQAVRGVYLNNASALFTGFTISNGQTYINGWWGDRDGGGIYIEDGGIVSNCVLKNSYSAGNGGGVYIYKSGTVTDCLIINNSANADGGGIYCQNATIKNNIIIGNSAERGGAVLCRTDSLVANCTILNNSSSREGGGIYSVESIVQSCKVSNNSSQYKGGGFYCDKTIIENCLINKNSVATGRYPCGGGVYCIKSTINNCYVNENNIEGEDATGGGVFCEDESLIMNSSISGNKSDFFAGGILCDNSIAQNCTITGNKSDQNSGGLISRYSEIKNSIIYYNSAPVFPNWNNESSSFKYNCTLPLPSNPNDENNISLSPKLLDNSHIAMDSPCNGAGNIAYCSGVDIDGQTWEFPGIIGCDQPFSGSVTGDLKISVYAKNTEFSVNYSNCFFVIINGSATSNCWDFNDGNSVANNLEIYHSWNTSGTYDVIVSAFNETYPGGVSATVAVEVTQNNIYYVSEKNTNPVPPYNTWETAAVNIQNAVNFAEIPGSIVRITNGFYLLPYQIIIDSEITVESVNGQTYTIVDGNKDSRCFYIKNPSAVLDGFTIKNGFATDEGGGVYSETGGNIKNCNIIKNSSEDSGGGIYFEVGGIIENCVVNKNSASGNGGGINCWHAGVVNSCTISENNSNRDGGGIFLNRHSLIQNSIIEKNISSSDGGGICSEQSTIKNCEIFKNSTLRYGGGGIYSRYYSLVQNCLISENSSEGSGGGVHGYKTVVQNCTIVNNKSKRLGGGIYCQYDNYIQNSVIWNNSTNSSFFDAEKFVYNSCIQNFTNLFNGIITNNPRFLSVNDFHLQNSSPCIDSGTNLAYVFDSFDLDGNPRLNNSSVDMGAYEFGKFYCSFFSDKTEGTNPLSCAFFATVSATNTDHLFYSWDFENDGIIDEHGESLFDISHTYSLTGDYSVLLIVSNSVGEKMECLKQNYIYVTFPVLADFSMNKFVAEIYGNVQFEDLTKYKPNFWKWSFEDSGTTESFEQNPVVSFDSLGYKTIKLVVSNDFSSDLIVKTNVLLIVEQTFNHYVSLSGNSTPPYTNWLTAATNIQDAIDESLTPDTIWVSNGVYKSEGFIKKGVNCFVLDKNVKIMGVGKKPIVDGQNKMRCAYVSGGEIENFIFINGKSSGDGGGVFCYGNSEISRSIFMNNHAVEGGGVCITNYDILKSCLIVSNTAKYGGGVKISRRAKVYNLTIADNSASEKGGGIFCGYYTEIYNSIIYNNYAASNLNFYNNGGSIYYYNCCTTPYISSSSNITNNPEFLVDYSIEEYTPCCDAGRFNSWMNSAKDIDGEARIQGDSVDIGAYETIPEPFLFGILIFGFIIYYFRKSYHKKMK